MTYVDLSNCKAAFKNKTYNVYFLLLNILTQDAFNLEFILFLRDPFPYSIIDIPCEYTYLTFRKSI